MSKETKPVANWGTGRRKTAIAQVRLIPGTGKIQINGRALETYFTEVKDRNAVVAPLETTENVGKYDLFVRVKGGGISGQAGAIRQGVARALKKMYEPQGPPPVEEGAVPQHTPMVKKLRDTGHLTRDARMKERKKYGRRGARRSFQFSKR